MTDRELAGCALVELQALIEWNRSFLAPPITPGHEAGVLQYFRRTPSSEGDGRDGEIARLNAALRYEQHRADRIGTHGPRCETWGPAHYECLLREVEGLRRDAERLDWLCAIDPARRVEGRMGFRAYEDVAPLDVEHSRWIALTDRFYGTAREAIDAAMSATGGDK